MTLRTVALLAALGPVTGALTLAAIHAYQNRRPALCALLCAALGAFWIGGPMLAAEWWGWVGAHGGGL